MTVTGVTLMFLDFLKFFYFYILLIILRFHSENYFRPVQGNVATSLGVALHISKVYHS